MKTAVWIWIVRIISLCVLGPFAGSLMSSLRAVDGSTHATAFVSGSFMAGLFALIGVFFLAMVGGVVATKAVSLREGVLNTGLIVAWGAFGSGQVGEALRGSPESGSLVMLMIEGVVVLVFSLFVLAMLTRVSGESEERDDCVRFGGVVFVDILLNAVPSLLLILIGFVISMLLVWLQTQSDLSGQSVWGGFIGAVAAGVLGGMVIKNHSLKHGGSQRSAANASSVPKVDFWGLGTLFESIVSAMVHSHKDRGERDHIELSLIPVICGVLLGAVVGPIIAMVMPGNGKVLQALASGDAPGWMLMSSLAWAGGALIGTPIGYSWVESSVERQQGHVATA